MFVPVFFVVSGVQLNLGALLDSASAVRGVPALALGLLDRQAEPA